MKRYLILAEGFSADPHYGKTASGVLRYRRDEVVAVLDSERAGADVDGVPIVATVAEGLGFGPTVALVGVATSGGRFPPEWRGILRACVEAGLDLENGLHVFLEDDPELAALAAEHGVELRDLRRPPADLTTPTGEGLRLPGRTVLTVGSDCGVGKMTVSLELDRELRARGVASTFVPTGQTGIAIAGWGISVDAVVADFIAGASERLVVEALAHGGTGVRLVEGQGSLVHPAYSGVTLGLLHGSTPDLLVLCHEHGQDHVEGAPEHPLPSLADLVSLYERMTLPAKPARVAAVALNTHAVAVGEARAAVAAAEAETGLLADDVVRFGAAKLADAIVETVR